jgi:LacI family transcriptional regulator
MSEAVEQRTSHNGRRGGVTIQEVARLAGVSPATVSRVLNRDERVGEEYRERVTTAVGQLNYHPNQLARNLRTSSSAAIALVVPDITNNHFTEMVATVEAEAYRHGYHVLVCSTDEQPDKQVTYLEMLVGERVLGVIISPSDPNGREIGRLIDEGIPVVAFDREVSDRRADAVIADNIAATREVTNLLIGAGHQDIVLVAGRPDVETGAERIQGYEEAMRSARLRPRSINLDFRVQGGYEGVGGLIDSGDPLSALVVSNNLMTLGALLALRERGVRIPEDIAMVAIDDPIWASLIDPPLTTVAQPVRDMALSAMRVLIRRLGHDASPPERLIHRFELRVRASCGTVVR